MMKRIPAILVLICSFLSAILLVKPGWTAADSYSEALEALAAGDTRKAIRLFSLAINADPDNFVAYNDRGVAHKAAGNPEKALADYTKALELKPDYANALNNRGVIYLQNGSYDKAIEDFTGALKSAEVKSKIHTNLGITYARKGDHQRAVKHLDAAISLRPLDHRAFLFMAESLEHLQEYEKAATMYQLALGLTKDSATADAIEKRIISLEKRVSNAGPQKDEVASRRDQPSGGSNGPAGSEQASEKKPFEIRRVLRAEPGAKAGANRDTKPAQSGAVAVQSIEELNRRCQSKATERFSPASAEIYGQGLQFLEKSDPRKALVRFEDVLQLEKRNRNSAAVAWSSLEAARAYLKIGDQLAAAPKLQDALRIFRQIKATDETILTLLEMAAEKKAVGQMDKASEIYSLAKEQASSQGYSRLAQSIGDIALGKVPAEPKQVASAPTEMMMQRQKITTNNQNITLREPKVNTSPQPSAQTVTRTEVNQPGKTAAGNATERSEKSEKVGRGPQVEMDAGRERLGPAARAESVSKTEPPTKQTGRIEAARSQLKMSLGKHPVRPGDKPLAIETKVGGEPIVPAERKGRQGPYAIARNEEGKFSPETKHQASAKRDSWDTQIKRGLAELRKYKDANDETNMVVILEKLAEAYVGHKQYDKALHSLLASLAFREKLGLNKGVERLYEKRGLIRERLGNSAGALADLTRALVLVERQDSSSTRKSLETKIRRVANEIGLEPTAATAAYENLWKARIRNDDRAETYALCIIGKLYDGAEKYEEALSYYDQSAASILADKARIYEKIGKKGLAEQFYRSALEAFKKLDYSRYLSLLKKSRAAETLTQY